MLLAVLLVLSLFGAQLVRLQGLDAASVSAAAVNGRLEVQAIPAQRGTILDAHGKELAVSVERRRIIADPTLVEGYTLRDDDGQVVDKGFRAAATVIAEVTDVPASAVLKALEEPLGEKYTILAADVSPQQWQDLRARSVRGVSSESFMRRDYPLGEAAAPLIGWVGSGDAPAGGLELVHNTGLTGTPGEAIFEVGSSGERISTGLYTEDPAEPGQDVRLSIDADLQWYAFDAVRKRVKESGALRGYAVVQEVATGRVVAMANYPSFDPAESSQSAEDMRNAAVEDVYEPGSTAKLITAAAVVEAGLAEWDTPVEVPVALNRGGTTFRDVEPHPVLHLTFAGVIAQSSNMGTILLGEKLGEQSLYDWIRKFGLGTSTGHGLPGESEGVVHAPGSAGWSDTSQYTMMFGQGMSGSILQQMGVFQAIANDGVRVPPTLVEGTLDHEGRYREAPVPEGTRVVAPETATTLTQIMQQIPSSSGTAPLAAVDGYHVAGKTSTADRYDPDKGGYNGVTSSFIGFAPVDDPKYVVGVAIQRPTKISRFGGIISGPVFSSIMRYALQKDGVPPATEAPLVLDLEYDPAARAPEGSGGATLDDIAIKDEGTP